MSCVLTSEMLVSISRTAGIVYFEDYCSCVVKMNGIKIHIKRLTHDFWGVYSPNPTFSKVCDTHNHRETFVCDEIELVNIMRRVSNASV